MIPKPCLLLIAAIVAPASSFAGPDDSWVGFAAAACMIQNPEYASLPTGMALSRSSGFLAWRKSLRPPVQACIATLGAVPDGLCSELLSADPTQRPEASFVSSLYEKYAVEIQKLDQLKQCDATK